MQTLQSENTPACVWSSVRQPFYGDNSFWGGIFRNMGKAGWLKLWNGGRWNSTGVPSTDSWRH